MTESSDPTEPASVDFGGSAISIGPATIPRSGAPDLIVPATALTSPATATASVIETIPAATSPFFLRYETILSFTAAYASGGGTPVAGLDYRIEPARGIVSNSNASRAISIAYTGSKQRMDVIGVDPNTGVVLLTQGTEYPTTASAWAATLPAGQIQLGRVFRTGSKAIVIPTWRWCNYVHIDRRADHENWSDGVRSRLAGTLRRLRAGHQVRVIFYGDSRLAQDASNRVINTVCNSNATATPEQSAYYHDRASIFSRWDAATRRHVGYDGRHGDTDATNGIDFGDGFGNFHSREGFGWTFVKQIAAHFRLTYGVDDEQLQVRNWAIGGTTAENSMRRGRANGLYPARLHAMAADIVSGETLVIDGFGMNDIGRRDFYENERQIIAICQAAGADVYKLGTGRPDPRCWPDLSGWYKTVRDGCRAADDAGAAYFDTTEILSPANLPALGLAEDQVCSGSNINHEGKDVHDAIGRAAAAPLLS